MFVESPYFILYIYIVIISFRSKEASARISIHESKQSNHKPHIPKCPVAAALATARIQVKLPMHFYIVVVVGKL